MKGIVKWFNTKKGYGFIEYKGKDIFIHYTGILDDGFKNLVEGEYVNFKIVNTPNGLKAKNVVSERVEL